MEFSGPVAFDGRWVTITKRGAGQAMKGDRRLSLSQITSVTFKPATALYHEAYAKPGLLQASSQVRRSRQGCFA